MKKIDEWRNCLTEEINQNKLMSKKLKNICRVLSYTERLLIVISTATGCISLSAFVSLVGIPIGMISSVNGLKNYVITAKVKKCKSMKNK